MCGMRKNAKGKFLNMLMYPKLSTLPFDVEYIRHGKYGVCVISKVLRELASSTCAGAFALCFMRNGL